MRSLLVVEQDEGAEHDLQLVVGGRLLGLGAQPLLHRLLEALDLAAGGGVVGAGVLLVDVEAAELGLQTVAAALAAGEAGGEDHAVVGQRRGGEAVFDDRLSEAGDDQGAGDGGVGGDAQGVAGTVVEPGQDLDVGTWPTVGTGQPVVGEVGLPALVGEVCLEAGVGGLGALGGRRYDEAVAGQVAADGGGRDAKVVDVSEVPGDGLGAGVESSRRQVATQLEDQGDGLRGDRGR